MSLFSKLKTEINTIELQGGGTYATKVKPFFHKYGLIVCIVLIAVIVFLMFVH